MSISIVDPTLVLDIAPISTNGTFATTTSPATIHVTTNNITGYTVGIKSSSMNTSSTTNTSGTSDSSNTTDTTSTLINSIEQCSYIPTPSKCLLPSIDSNVSLEEYSTSTELNNTWGYLPSKLNSLDNTDYLPAPNSTVADIIDITNTPNTVDIDTGELLPNEYTINIGARVDYTSYAGQYSGTFIVTTIGNPVPYSVSYDSNVPEDMIIEGDNPNAELLHLPNAQAGEVSSGDTIAVVLSENIPILSGIGPYDTDRYDYHFVGYVFGGWCTEPTITPDTLITPDNTTIPNTQHFQVCPDTATIYNPGDPYGIDQTITNHTTLHAIWTYATDIQFSGNGSDGGEQMKDLIIPAGETATLSANTFAKTDYDFIGWNTVPTPTEQDPGTSYEDEAEYTSTRPEDITLYAQWEPPYLYKKVRSMVKRDENGNERMQSLADMQAAITSPTTTDPTTDTSNSGVYKYDPDTYGVASDAGNDYAIYYYRGILEPEADQGSYGSDGKATTYPNYVRLGNDTCWRIVRTTGSGGIKMIYNGLWDNADSTCANTTTDAQAGISSLYRSTDNIVYPGYTHNSAMTGVKDSINVSTVFGNNENPALNDKKSNLKAYIEAWYADNMIDHAGHSYTDQLEPLAGYCNDRTVYDGSTGELLNEVAPQQNLQVNFGALKRVNLRTVTLNCPRGEVDNYRYITNSTGTGNELQYPTALLTADEISMAGNGYSGKFPYNIKSFLVSGSIFWSLSPYDRNQYNYAREFALGSNGILTKIDFIHFSYGVRPAISFKHETTAVSGSGTTTDPWLIDE